MEQKPTNIDEKIETGVAFWRSYPVPPIPAETQFDALQPRRAGLRSLRWTAPVLAIAACATVVLWPTNSHARDVASALAALDTERFFKEHIRCTDQGKLIVDMTLWKNGSDLRLEQHENPRTQPASQETWFLDGETTTLLPKEGYAVRHRDTRRSHGIAGQIDVKHLIEMNGKGGVREFDNETWRGRSVIRYELNTGPLKDGGGNIRSYESTMIVDPTTNLPLEVSSKNGGLGDTVCDFEYPEFDPNMMAVSIPADVPIYDLDGQRAEIKKSVMTPMAIAHVGSKTIALRALVVDHYGLMAAWTTGGDPEPPSMTGEELMKADGFRPYYLPQNASTALPTGSTGTKSTAVQWVPPKPEMYRGLPLIKEQQQFAKSTIFPERLTVRIPVWGANRRAPIGYAVFKNVKPTVTGSTVQLMWPMNVDIFVAKPDQIR